MHLSYLEWDSHCFGYQVGEMSASATYIATALQEARQQGYRLLYLRAAPQQALHLAALQAGAVWADEKITFLQKTPQNPPPSEALVYEAPLPNAALRSLALQSGQFSRFRTDVHFQNNEFEKLYTAWIEKALKKELAEQVFVAKRAEKVIGLLTLGIKNQIADIGLFAVDAEARALGIGKQLLYKAFAESKAWGLPHIQVISQKANEQACKFYMKQGFAIEKIENIYHFWLD
jgi:dTDP-4-amino-4,6-dideoxy-D-galactose acyltransferase